MKIQGLYIHPSLDFVPLPPPPTSRGSITVSKIEARMNSGGKKKQKQRKLDDAQEKHWELNNGLGSSALSSASSAS